MEMLRAKDIMTKEVVTIRKDSPVCEAIQLLLKNEVAGIPVVEEDMTLVGILTEKDVLGLYYAPEDTREKKAGEFMTQPAVHVDENEDLEEICNCLLDVTFRRVPVTSSGKVVGVISRPDVIRWILELAGENAPVPEGG
jgi:CBS domain-containing protein